MPAPIFRTFREINLFQYLDTDMGSKKLSHVNISEAAPAHSSVYIKTDLAAKIPKPDLGHVGGCAFRSMCDLRQNPHSCQHEVKYHTQFIRRESHVFQLILFPYKQLAGSRDIEARALAEGLPLVSQFTGNSVYWECLRRRKGMGMGRVRCRITVEEGKDAALVCADSA